MGRAPCCDKANVKKGPWSPEEDAKLKSYIEQNGTGGNWIALPQKMGLKRCGKSCRLRWLNYLRPNIKHGGFSDEEDNIIYSLYISIGSRWSIIASQLPGRTDNDIKNYWNTRLKKKLLGKHRKENVPQPRRGSSSRQDIKTKSGNVVGDRQPACWLEPPMVPMYSTAHIDEPPSNNHVAIRKLLLGMGNSFDEEGSSSDHSQRPWVHQNTVPFNHGSSSIPTTMVPAHTQSSGNFSLELEEMLRESAMKIDGQEPFYPAAAEESVNWNEVSLSFYPNSLMHSFHATYEEQLHHGMQMH